MSNLRRLARLSTLLRSLTVQASWNPRTRMGTGFSYLIRPLLRGVMEETDGSSQTEVERPGAHFNTHPYFASLVAGAIAREESDGTNLEQISVLERTLSGALGGLGDRFFWGGLRPVILLAGLVFLVAGASPLWVIAGLLVLYNSIQLRYRWWGLSVGLRAGREVAGDIAKEALGRRADWLALIGTGLIGVLAGMIAGVEATGDESILWITLALVGFLVGAGGGVRRGKWATVGLILGLGFILLCGALT